VVKGPNFLSSGCIYNKYFISHHYCYRLHKPMVTGHLRHSRDSHGMDIYMLQGRSPWLSRDLLRVVGLHMDVLIKAIQCLAMGLLRI
jgi:hypothetical protein